MADKSKGRGGGLVFVKVSSGRRRFSSQILLRDLQTPIKSITIMVAVCLVFSQKHETPPPLLAEAVVEGVRRLLMMIFINQNLAGWSEL